MDDMNVMPSKYLFLKATTMIKTLLPIGLLATTIGFAQAGDTIPELASSSGRLDTLVSVVKAADLAGALSGDGPFTVFAPTDEAFAKLPKDTVEDLLKPENKAKLVDILTYHVVSGKVMAETAVTLDKATALNKKVIVLAVKDGVLTLNGSDKVVTADIDCSNGVIHVIDAVILPPSE